MMRLFKKNDRGQAVSDIQTRLAALGYEVGSLGADGVFGETTEKAVKKFQRDQRLPVDGIVGGETWRKLVEANYRLGDRLLYLRSPFFHGDDVKHLQKWLNVLGFNSGRADGVFGILTERAVREFQSNTGLPSDGIVGTSTIAALRSLRTILSSNAQASFPREAEKEISSISLFKGRRIVVDFGGNYPQEDSRSSTDLKESQVSSDLALRFGNLVSLLGARVTYTTRPQQSTPPPLGERIKVASEAKADLFISFGLSSSKNIKESGITTLYFGKGKKLAGLGKQLAQVIQRELVNSTGCPDLGVSRADFPELSQTNMVGVFLKPAFITNKEEEALLQKEAFRQKIAVAAFDGLLDYFKLQKSAS